VRRLVELDGRRLAVLSGAAKLELAP